MKDPQDPSNDGLDPASDDSSGESSNEPSKESSSASSNEIANDAPGDSPAGHSGDASVEQSSLPTPPPLVGPESPRRLDVDPDSPMAVVASIARLSTGARIAELQAVAGLFLAEVIDRLRYVPEGEIYYHDTFTRTAERFIAARDGKPTAAPAEPDHTEPEDTEPKELDRTAAASPAPLPNFPKFRLNRSFNSWAHEFAAKEDVAELTAVLGATNEGAYNEITNAITLVFGLPKFLDRCLNGEFTIEHVLVATRAVKDVDFEYVPRLDSYLGRRRADITIETFRKSLNLKIASLVPVDDRLEVAAKRRHVDITTNDDGTASVLLSGPAVELQAFYLRIEAFARAIRKGNISAFTDADLSGTEVGEQDSIAALMFDIATRATPQMFIAVTTHDTTTGETSTKEIPLDLVETGDRMAPISADAVNRAARSATQEAEDAAAPGVDVKSVIKLVMPTHGQWVREQAKMMVTVPYLTAIGRSELPGTFSDGAPVPTDAAKALAGESPAWHRILTDPASGTPIDARSKSYHIPADVRAPLTAKWQSCSVPGCTRRAETSEIDHITPFDHDDPARGGQTTFMNTHPLCKAHHQLKTDRKFSIRTTEDGAVEYAFSHNVVTTIYPPDNPIHAEHARQVENYAQLPDELGADWSGSRPGLVDDWAGTEAHLDASAGDGPEMVAADPREVVAGDKWASDTAEADQAGTTGGSELRHTSESDGSQPATEGDDAQKARRSREAQELFWNVSWDPENPPPF